MAAQRPPRPVGWPVRKPSLSDTSRALRTRDRREDCPPGRSNAAGSRTPHARPRQEGKALPSGATDTIVDGTGRHRANEARLAIRARPDAAPYRRAQPLEALSVGAIAVFVVVATLIVDASFIVGFLRARTERASIGTGSRRLHRQASLPAPSPRHLRQRRTTRHRRRRALRPMPRRPSTARPEQTPRQLTFRRSLTARNPSKETRQARRASTSGARPPTRPGNSARSACSASLARARREERPPTARRCSSSTRRAVTISKLHCL